MYKDIEEMMKREFKEILLECDVIEKQEVDELEKIILEKILERYTKGKDYEGMLIPMACAFAFDSFARKKRLKNVRFYKRALMLSLKMENPEKVIWDIFLLQRESLDKVIVREPPMLISVFVEKRISDNLFIERCSAFFEMNSIYSWK